MDKTIYLEADEEITSVVDRLKKIKEEKIALVIPKRATLIGSIVNLKLLKKLSQELGKEVSIVTIDKIGRNLASQVGFTVYKKIDGKEVPTEVSSPPKVTPEISYIKKDIEEPQKMDIEKKPLIDREEKESKIKPRINEIKEKISKSLPDKMKRTQDKAPAPFGGAQDKPILKKKKRRRPVVLPSFNKKFLIIFIILSLSILGIVGFLILPRVNITIYPKVEILPYDLDLTVGSSIKETNYEGSTIPGDIIYTEKEETREFTATGKKDVGEKSSGSVIIKNEWDSNPQELVVNTRFLSSDGKLFRSTSGVTVPGTTVHEGQPIAGTASVSVVADQPGEEYNIGSSNFVIPGLPAAKQEKIYAISDSNMTGGFSKQVTIVSQNDLNTAQDAISNDLFTSAEVESREKVDNKIILDEAIFKEIVENSPSVQAGAEGENFNLKIKVKVQIMVFSEDNLKDISSSKLITILPQDKELVYDGKNDISYKIVSVDFSSGIMILKTHIDGLVSSQIKQDELKQGLVNKTQQQAEEYLKDLDRFEKVIVNLWPSWVKKVPTRKSNIKFDIQTEKPSEIKEVQPEEKTAE